MVNMGKVIEAKMKSKQEFKMSQARFDELQKELNYLKTTRSDEVAEQIKVARVIEALTGKVSDGYLRYLRERGISYVFAGEDRLDCGLLARKLLVRFGIRRLMVAGGGVADWSFLREGLLDELSLVLTPIADGSTTAVSIFENADFLPPHPPAALRLLEVKQLEGDVLWLRYQPK